MSVETTSLQLTDKLDTAVELQTLGISSDWEAKRFNEVAQIAGITVAKQEVQANINAYKREFLEDEPVSHAHEYYHMNGELFSQQIEHPLFKIKSQIDPRERDGVTYQGFINFEKIVTEPANNENVVLWYSPAGKAGTQEPFNKIFFDAGRLYFCVKGQQQKSVHIDVKINEDYFPIVEFMEYIEGYQALQRPPMSEEQSKYHYLEHPLSTNLSSSEFFQLARQFIQSYRLDEKTAYTSRRNSYNAHNHTFQNIFDSLKQQLSMGERSTLKMHALYTSYDDKANTEIGKEAIVQLYQGAIYQYMQQHGLEEITLYGCSTTSAVSVDDLTGDFMKPYAKGSLNNQYSTPYRLTSSNIGASINDLLQQRKNFPDDASFQLRCPFCRHEDRYNVGEIKRAGKLECKECSESTDCWEPIVASKLQVPDMSFLI